MTLTGLTGENGTEFLKEVTFEQSRRHQNYNGNRQRSRHKSDRPFIAWDGEGVTSAPGQPQDYVLFGASTGDYLTGKSLGTRACLDLILSVERQHPDAIHVGFAFKYDVNQILSDLPRRSLHCLRRRGRVKWEGYHIEYRPGKWLNVSRKEPFVTARLYDSFGFFQSSFITACEKFLGNGDPEVESIRAGKAARSSFRFDELAGTIIPYWRRELALLVRLMESLRRDLQHVGVLPNSWHGPGAVANAVYRQRNCKQYKEEAPQEVRRAAQFAFSGGWFELFQAGYYPHSVWEYDINSAYPAAIAELPSLAGGTWELVRDFQPGSFGVWHISTYPGGFRRPWVFEPQPLFYRDERQCISRPAVVEGWYWTPEAEHVPSEWIIEGWVFHPKTDAKPFAFVAEYYATRRIWKQPATYNSAERALKLILNSLYGKMAQRIGWTEENPVIPSWHQLEWAGYVTARTRAKLWDAFMLAPKGSVIAIETDALFTTSPLSLDCGEGLGQWEETKLNDICYLQNGFYFAHDSRGALVEKYRGFDKGCISYDQVLDHLSEYGRCQQEGTKLPTLSGVTTRYIGMGIGLLSKKHAWRSWATDERHVIFGGGGKRTHLKPKFCPTCKKGGDYITGGFHPLAAKAHGGISQPHRLPWVDESKTPEELQLEYEETW